MNIKINGTVVSIATAIICQFAGIVFFISGLSSNVENNDARISKIEASITEVSASIESLDKSITLLADRMETINSEHKMLFESGTYGDKYVPGEMRKY